MKATCKQQDIFLLEKHKEVSNLRAENKKVKVLAENQIKKMKKVTEIGGANTNNANQKNFETLPAARASMTTRGSILNGSFGGDL